MIFSAASALPSDLRMMAMISSRASKTFSKPFEDVDALLRAARARARSRLVTTSRRKCEEVPEHLLEVEPLGAAGLGVLGRHQAGQVDGEVGLQRRVLEQVRHDHLLVGVPLQLERDADVVGGQVLDVDQVRQLARQHDVADPLDQHRLVHGVGDAGDVDRLLGAADRAGFPGGAQPDAAAAGAVDLLHLVGRVEDLAAGREVRALHPAAQLRHREVGVVEQLDAAPGTPRSRLCGGMLVAMPTAMPVAPLTSRFGMRAGSTTGSVLVPS